MSLRARNAIAISLILVSFVLLLMQAFSQLVKQVDVIAGNVAELDHHEGEPEAHL